MEVHFMRVNCHVDNTLQFCHSQQRDRGSGCAGRSAFRAHDT